MWNGLEELIDLQRMDQTIARLEAEARQIPRQIAALEADLGRARGAWEAAKAAAGATAKERRERERELEEEAGNQRKKQGRLFEIKTNLEYSAVLKEIEQLKEKVSALETRILELMDEQEQAGKRATEAETAFRAAEAVHRRDCEAREKDLARLQGELVGLQKARKQVAGKVDRELYQVYARIMKIRDGTAVVPVREGSCAGCFVALPPQTYNEVRQNDRRITCPHCERILYSPSAGAAAEGGVRTDAAVP
jgi:predicted  nucleic acid-binding Zn-ribbon protein